MAEFLQVPGTLNITATHGDDFSFYIDFDVALGGYTFTANVITSSTNASVAMTVTAVDLALGQLTISLTKTALNAIANGKHHWEFTWTTGGLSRKVLSGTFSVVDYA